MLERRPAAIDDPLVGRIFGGKYTIERLIGRGGVGLVYLASCHDEDREVVLKLLAPDWIQNPEAVKRFEREAKRLGEVKHPNIVRMYDYGHHGGRAYLAMEYLQGQLLSDYLSSRGPLPLETFVPIAAQVLKGIGHAHTREVMVRDVKPANIMLCERKGRSNFVKILDFGLAKLLKDEHPVTEEHIVGTAGYLAPEAIKGEPVDLTVDVFAIGVLFYTMLAGHVPFQGNDSATVFYKTIDEPAPPLAQALPAGHSIPPGLLALIHRCLEKDPARRPADANGVVEELIDVVPAALFRLPRIKPYGAVRAAGFGNTGLVELVGPGAISAQHPVAAPVAPAAPTRPATPKANSTADRTGELLELPGSAPATPAAPAASLPEESPRKRRHKLARKLAASGLVAIFLAWTVSEARVDGAPSSPATEDVQALDGAAHDRQPLQVAPSSVARPSPTPDPKTPLEDETKPTANPTDRSPSVPQHTGLPARAKNPTRQRSDAKVGSGRPRPAPGAKRGTPAERPRPTTQAAERTSAPAQDVGNVFLPTSPSRETGTRPRHAVTRSEGHSGDGGAVFLPTHDEAGRG